MKWLQFQSPEYTSKPRPAHCGGCPFRSRTCGPKGPTDSPIVIVGESPGVNEVREGIPFVGAASKVLYNAFPKDLQDIEPYITNAVKCLPVDKNSSNMVAACQSCRSILLEEIKAHPRKIILALGGPALQSLTGNYSLKITQVRGEIFNSDLAECGIVACVHPAFLLRQGGSSRLFNEDVQKAFDLLTGRFIRKHVDADCILMETEDDIKALIEDAGKQEYIAADIETSALKFRRGSILSQGFCWDPKTAYIVPPELFRYLGPIYDPQRVKARFIWHNGKFDVLWLRYEATKGGTADIEGIYQIIRHKIYSGGPRDGYQFAKVDEDTMLLHYAIEENRGIHDLEQVSTELLNAPNWKDVITSWLPKKGASYANVPPLVLYKYQAKDLSNTLQCFFPLRERVAKDPKLELLYTKTLIPACEVTHEMEFNGIKANKPKFAENRAIWQEKIAEAKKRVNSVAREVLGTDINPGSWQQVQRLLYVEGLNLASGKTLSTDEKTLTSSFLQEHPVIGHILDYRGYVKSLGTYIDGFEEAIDNDGRIHASVLLHGTTTGRPASRDPNIFNVQRTAELRDQFEAEEGYELIEVDLSQAELRSLACLSKDKNLCRIYQTAGESIHKVVSRKFFGPDWTNKTPEGHEQYMRAKAVTFGIVYGREAFSLAQEFKITTKEAQAYIDGWFDQFPEAHDFIMKCRMAPMQGKILQTPFGRKRRFGIVSYEKAHDIQNQAANFPHQSIASDITLHAAIELLPTIKRWNVKLVNWVYDALYFECPKREDLICDVTKLAMKTMEAVPPKWGPMLQVVPFTADAKRGKLWGSMEEFVPI